MIEYEVELDKRRVFTTYSGADMSVFVNGRVVGEIEQIDWKEDMLDGVYDGYIDVTIFGDECGLKAALREQEGDETIFELHFMSEHGQSTIIEFVDITFVERKGVFSTDMTALMERYKFLASDMVFKPQNLIAFDPMDEAEGEHVDERREKVLEYGRRAVQPRDSEPRTRLHK